jgi:hypothetical protein
MLAGLACCLIVTLEPRFQEALMPVGWVVVVVALYVVVIAVAVVLIGLLRQITQALERAVGGPAGPAENLGPLVGDQVPRFSALDANGEPVSDQELRGQSAVLLFLSVGCGPCLELAAELRQTPDLGGLASQLIVVTGPDGPEALRIPAGLRIVTEPDGKVAGALNVFGWPFAVALNPEGIVKAVQVPNTVEQLNNLAATVS